MSYPMLSYLTYTPPYLIFPNFTLPNSPHISLPLPFPPFLSYLTYTLLYHTLPNFTLPNSPLTSLPCCSPPLPSLIFFPCLPFLILSNFTVPIFHLVLLAVCVLRGEGDCKGGWEVGVFLGGL